MTLRFYMHPLSGYSQKVMYFMAEAGLTAETIVVDLTHGEQARPGFRAINPFGKVPAVTVGEFSIYESNAILRYLAQRFQKHDFWPENLEDRACVDQLMEYTNLHLNRFLMNLAWELHWAVQFGYKPTLATLESDRAALQRNLTSFERHLSGRTWLAGSNPTLADVCLMPFMAQHRLAQVSLADFPATQAWYSRMESRPAWQRVLAECAQLSGR